MRLRSATLFAALLGLIAGGAQEAPAATAVGVVWTSTTGAGTPGGSSIDAAPGDQLVAQIRITPDGGGLAAYAVSLEFDTDLGDELDLVSVTEFLPGSMEFAITPGVDSTQESTGAQKGYVYTYEAVTLTIPGPSGGTVVAGEVTFNVTPNVMSDGVDVLAGTFNINADGVGNNSNAIVSPVFSGAAVNSGAAAIPTLSEWGVIVMALLLLATGTIVWSRRPATATAGGVGPASSFDQPLFVPDLFMKALAGTLVVVMAGFALAFGFQGELEGVDIAGALLCAPIAAYLVHLWVTIARRED